MLNVTTIKRLKAATCCVMVPHPDPKYKGFAIPRGTGFFISSSGYFITALHVISQGSNLLEVGKIRLEQANDDVGDGEADMAVNNLSLIKKWDNYDLALLKAEHAYTTIADAMGGHLKEVPFNFLEIDFNSIPIGTDVYSYGYPLPDPPVIMQNDNVPFIAGWNNFSPRLTSAVISSHNAIVGPARGSKYPQHYVIDKALNYGNSGGPIVVQESGKVISVAVSFQPVQIPQKPNPVMIPSLYGITRSLRCIERDLKSIVFVCSHDYAVITDVADKTISECSKCGHKKIVYK
jgi:serine protease Do